MGLVTASDTFDSEDLDSEVSEQIEPLVTWLNENMINIVSLLSGGLSSANMAIEFIQVKAQASARNSVKTSRKVENVSFSRVVTQGDPGLVCTGFNWTPTQEGFEYAVTFSTGTQYSVILKVEYNV